VTGLILIAANVAVNRLAAHVPARVLLHKLAAAPSADVIALGNSTMAAGFDEAAFARAWMAANGEKITALNGALGATESVPHLLLARAALRPQPHSRIVVYGFFDFMLTDPAPDWRTLMGNNSMVFYTEPGLAARYLAPNLTGRMAFRAAGTVPLFVERGNIWAYVERLRRNLGGLGLPAAAVNQFGQTADFDQLLTQDVGKFGRRAEELVAQNAPLADPVEALLGFAREQGRQVYVVAMPLPGAHRAYYRLPAWAAYLSHLRGRLDALGCKLLVANEWIADDGSFVDALHLSAAGAAEFSQRLARELTLQAGPTVQPR